MNSYYDYPARIAEARRRKGLSQEKLALEIGVTPKTISKIELGITNPRFEIICNISQVLDISLSEMVGQDVSISQMSKSELSELVKEAVRLAMLESRKGK